MNNTSLPDMLDLSWVNPRRVILHLGLGDHATLGLSTLVLHQKYTYQIWYQSVGSPVLELCWRGAIARINWKLALAAASSSGV